MLPAVHLRVLITGVRVKEARPYFLTLQTLKSRDSPPNVLFAGDDVRDVVGALRSNAGQTGRTETTDTTASPEFTNRAFVLAVPRDSAGPLANKLHDGGKDGADLNAELGSSGPPALHCQLFAASSSLSSARNEDVLIGEGFVDFFGTTVERLQRGEAVSLNVALDAPEGGSPAQVSLQVTMLDTDARPKGGRAGDSKDGGRTVRCHVLVANAEGLSDENGRDPSAFVAAKTMREAAARLPSRAATRAVPRTRDPTWNEIVTVEVAENELDREKVLLAVVNHDTNKLMGKVSIPLKGVAVGRHYNMKLTLGGGASLCVSVIIPAAPARELARVRGDSDALKLEASITGVHALDERDDGYAGPVVAVWRMARDGKAALAAGETAHALWTTVDGGREDAIVKAMAQITSEAGTDASPTLQGATLSGPPLWPSGHRASFLTSASMVSQSRSPALVLELHNDRGMIGRAVIPASDLGRGGRPSSLNDVPLYARGGDEAGRVNITARAWPRDAVVASREKEIAGGFAAGGGGLGVGGDGAWMLSAMATDMMDKQAAMEDAMTRLDAAEKRCESLKWRVQDAESARKRLEADNTELRRLLHEEKNADPAAGLALMGDMWDVNDVMAAKERVGQIAARYAAEKRRNTELIHRLKAMHEATVGAEHLKARHQELQEAHAFLSKSSMKWEREAKKVMKCKETIAMQEGIIARLETVLEQAVVDQRRLAEAEHVAGRLQDANELLKGGADWEELDALREENTALRRASKERETDQRDMQSDRVALTLRLEKAEAAAIASNNEMLEVSRRCAREIAALRSKLAEKDAQLMGGFGSVANLVLEELPPSKRLTAMEPPVNERQVGRGGGLLEGGRDEQRERERRRGGESYGYEDDGAEWRPEYEDRQAQGVDHMVQRELDEARALGMVEESPNQNGRRRGGGAHEPSPPPGDRPSDGGGGPRGSRMDGGPRGDDRLDGGGGGGGEEGDGDEYPSIMMRGDGDEDFAGEAPRHSRGSVASPTRSVVRSPTMKSPTMKSPTQTMKSPQKPPSTNKKKSMFGRRS